MHKNPKLEDICKFAYSFKETVYDTYEKSLYALTVMGGDFVECGVAAGSQIAAMQLAIQRLDPLRRIWGFDSFEGIPLAGEFDTEQAGIGEITHNKYAPLRERLVSSGVTVHSVENVLTNFISLGLPTHNLSLVKGWFQDTLPVTKDQIESIALLRLDGDLYESTLVCLEHLYPKVLNKGVVIIDDYALEGCRVAVEHYFKSIKKAMPQMIPVEGGGGVVWFLKQD